MLSLKQPRHIQAPLGARPIRLDLGGAVCLGGGFGGSSLVHGGTLATSTQPLLAATGVGGIAAYNDGALYTGSIITSRATVSTTSFTIATVVQFASSGVYGSVVDRDINTGRVFRLSKDTSNRIELYRFNTAVTSYGPWTTTGTVSANVPVAVVAVVRGANIEIYLGAEVVTGSITGTPAAWGGVFAIGASYGGTAGTDGFPAFAKLNGLIYFSAVLPYAISIAEAKSAAVSPAAMYTWMFGQSRIYIPTAPAAATVPTLSASTYVPGSLTSTGWRPQITAS